MGGGTEKEESYCHACISSVCDYGNQDKQTNNQIV